MQHNIQEIWNQKKAAMNFASLSLEEIQLEFNSFYLEIEPTLNISIEELQVDNKITQVLPAIRMMLSEKNIKVASIKSNSLIKQIFQDLKVFKSIENPVTPCELLLSGLPALYIESTDNVLKEFSEKLEEYKKEQGFNPDIIAIKDLGLITVSYTSIGAEMLQVEFEKKLKLSLYGGSKLSFLNKEEIVYISELRKTKDEFQLKGKVSQKVVVITGGAQGFGGGVAEEMLEQHANLVIADINEKAGNEFVEKLNNQRTENLAIFVKTDVSNAESVQNLIYQTVKRFGGIDIFISNAGVLRAGGLDEMSPETFEIVTKVNYNGYFLCVKYCSEVMKVQSKYKPGYYTDIIQINSKSGLKGSNKNFAYSGGKFGGIGLTQSFALELMPFNIKVNSICPGNFFDGPLWSDPVNGLFVQYLNAGKIPGAKSVNDIKKFYEAQVPAKRGCSVNDVLKAIYYVIEQEYETGQAVPVTGGQNMLR